MLYITNATIYTPTQRIERGAVLTDGGRIVAAGPAEHLPCPPDAQVIDADGLLLTPGFIELQFNGGFGQDFTDDPTAIWPVAAQLPQHGVTAFLPTIITAPLAKSALGRRIVTEGRPTDYRGAMPLGLHIEGPFLNPAKKGAHNPNYLRLPTLDAVADWSPETGVRLVTLAPELPGALEVIEALSSRGILVSTGHSMATYDQAVAGFDDDRRLSYREDKALWGASRHQIVTVRVPRHATPAQVIAAINAKTTSAVGDVRTTAKLTTAKPRAAYVMAWELGRGATVKAPWGSKNRIAQTFLARS